MTYTLNPSKKINELVQTLSIEKQQEVLDFAEFLPSKIELEKLVKTEEKPISFLGATQEFAGCLDGSPSDLSTNKKYLEDLGKY